MTAGGTAAAPARAVPLLLAAPVLAAGAALPGQADWLCAVAVIVALGVPHGALDVEIGRNLLRGRLGRWWFPAFAGPYLLLVGAVLLAWRWYPEATLAAFLLASVWHFGTEETGEPGVTALAWGGLPVAVPVLLQPAATARFFSVVAGVPLDGMPPWLLAGSVAWLVPLAFAVVAAARCGGRGLRLLAACAAGFAVLPPLTAFALFFVAVHAPAHVAGLVGQPGRAPRVRGAWSAWRVALPTTLLTAAIGAALWPTFPGHGAPRLVCLTVQLLAAFTLPHMLLDAWFERREPIRSPATQNRQQVGLATRGGTRQRSTISALPMAKRPELHHEAV